jgi:hypothetical protein
MTACAARRRAGHLPRHQGPPAAAVRGGAGAGVEFGRHYSARFLDALSEALEIRPSGAAGHPGPGRAHGPAGRAESEPLRLARRTGRSGRRPRARRRRPAPAPTRPPCSCLRAVWCSRRWCCPMRLRQAFSRGPRAPCADAAAGLAAGAARGPAQPGPAGGHDGLVVARPRASARAGRPGGERRTGGAGGGAAGTRPAPAAPAPVAVSPAATSPAPAVVSAPVAALGRSAERAEPHPARVQPAPAPAAGRRPAAARCRPRRPRWRPVRRPARRHRPGAPGWCAAVRRQRLAAAHPVHAPGMCKTQ